LKNGFNLVSQILKNYIMLVYCKEELQEQLNELRAQKQNLQQNRLAKLKKFSENQSENKNTSIENLDCKIEILEGKINKLF
jgi:L-lactate utilization protein LutB